MFRKATTLCGVLALGASHSALLAQATVADTDVLTSVVLVEEKKDYDRAISTLDSAVRRLEKNPGRSRDLPQARLYLGVAYAAKGLDGAARRNFRAALQADPSLVLNRDRVPRRAVELFEGVRADAAKGAAGGSKAPLVVLGLAAAGGGVYLATREKGDQGPSTATDVFQGNLSANHISESRTLGPFRSGGWRAEITWTNPRAQLVVEVYRGDQGLVARGGQTGATSLVAAWDGIAGAPYRIDTFLASPQDTGYEVRVTHPIP